jgi:hypothetical protein
MQVMNVLAHRGRRGKPALLVSCLAVLLTLLLPSMAFAGSPAQDAVGPETCAGCHPSEATVWGDSPHAKAENSSTHTAVTCEVCHGAYVPNHPQDGLMQLPADGTCCQTCHTDTYEQWHETAHEGANVQCTSCHVPHSQDTRLAAEELCESCHREEAEHWVHHEAGVHCTDCHLAVATPPVNSTDVRVMAGDETPDHRFKLAVEACVDCHSESIHDRVFHEAAGHMEISQLSEMTDRTRELAYELEDAKQSNRSLRSMSVVSLGFGLGTGGVLGAIFVLVVGYVVQGRGRQ